MFKMKRKKIIQFTILFALLGSFSLISLGLLSAQKNLIETVSAAGNGNNGATFLTVQDSLFDSKVLSFITQQKVCQLTTQQANVIKNSYSTESKQFTVNGNPVYVIYINGNPLNKKVVEKILGQSLDDSCQVVHGNKVIAVLTPVFIS